MEAHAARESRRMGSWRHALESRRVLAVLLIAPAVLFMAVVVGVPFVWAIYLSFTDAIGGPPGRSLGGVGQLPTRLERRQLPARTAQHARLHARVTGDRRRGRGGPVELPRP